MRELLFRGKRFDNGEWVESGNIIRFNPERGEDLVFIPGMNEKCISTHDEFDNIVAFVEVGFYKVNPKTVGQFTGLTDKNDERIFEGDIVHVLGNQQVEDWKNVNYIGSIAFLDAGFCVIDGTIEDHAFRRYQLPRLDFDLEVIGNIHDNPELLEV